MFGSNLKRAVTAVVFSLLAVLYSAQAHATIITAVYTGTAGDNYFGGHSVYYGQSAVMTFQFDSATVGPVSRSFYAGYGNVSSFSGTLVVGDVLLHTFVQGDPRLHGELGLADATLPARSLYDVYLEDATAYFQGWLSTSVTGITTIDPGQTFVVTNIGNLPAGPAGRSAAQIIVGGNNFMLSLDTLTVTSSDSATVPAPSTLALLVIGLFGVCGMRRKLKAA